MGTARLPSSRRHACPEALQHGWDDPQRVVDLVSTDVAMRYEAEPSILERHRQDTLGAEIRADSFGIEILAQTRNHDVGDDLIRVDLDTGDRGQPVRETVCVAMVLLKLWQQMVESVEAGGGQNTGLVDGSAQHFAYATGGLGPAGVTDDDRSRRRPQPLGEIDHDRIEAGAQRRQGAAIGDRGVRQPRAVKMQPETGIPCTDTDLVHRILVEYRPTGEVVCILETDQASLSTRCHARAYARADIIPR